MTYIDDYFKGLTNTNVAYEATTPSVSRDGRSASFTMYIEDTTIEVDADLGYDGNRDEVTIELVYADAYDEDKEKCFKAGMNAHVSKPIDSEMLFQTLLETMTAKSNFQDM